MCRLFFYWSTTTPNPSHVITFLEQSTHKKKYTPGLNNHRDRWVHVDGYGLAILRPNHSSWKVHKYPGTCEGNPRCLPEIERLMRGVQSTHILGHIRTASKNSAVVLENTHPFVYQDNVFAHNGGIRDFEQHRSSLLKHVSPKYRSHILGTTDTEVLFYMWLTRLRDGFEQGDTDTVFRRLHRTTCALFNIFESKNMEITANMMWSNRDFAVITRYIHYDSANYRWAQHPLSMYINGVDRGEVLVSSEPITSEYRVVPENTVVLVDLRLGVVDIRPLHT